MTEWQFIAITLILVGIFLEVRNIRLQGEARMLRDGFTKEKR